ncbi:MAG: glycosyltransferase family 4 protein [Actinobacteria bacterium]|nr:glycosyltransferase family 4 protein [Actinomycetota bacterium]
MSARPLRVMCLSNMYPGPGAPDYGAFIERMCDSMEQRGVEVHRVVIRTRSSGRLRTPLKYAGLTARALVASLRADVIWAHYLFPTGLIAAIAGSAARTPWVITAHGGDVANLSNGMVRRLSGPPAHAATAVIAVSEWLGGRMYAEGLRPERVEVASMGVDARRFAIGDRGAARERLGLPPDAPVVLAVGGLSARKNPLGLMRAFAILRGEMPDARLAFVGSGPLAGAVDAQARRMGLDDVVIRTGLVPNAAVTDWMTACDVVALVSLVEPLGVAALEAMASGRPVVGTEVGGLKEVVPGGLAGLIVDPHDDAAIAAALARMIIAPPDPSTCREAALAHSLDVETDHVLEVLAAAARA